MLRLSVSLYEPRVFWRKVATVTLALFALEPMLYFKLYVPSIAYLASILSLHAVFLYIYAAKMPWRALLLHKKALSVRLLGIVIVAYLLTLLQSRPSLSIIFVNTLFMALLHAGILALLMIKEVHFVTSSRAE